MTAPHTIPAQPRRAMLRMLPWALLLAPFLGLALWFRFGDEHACAPQLLGVPQAYWAILAMTAGIPLLLLLFTLAQLPTAIKILRHGYFPPLDSINLFTSQARQGPLAKLRGCLMLAAPLLATGILLLGHNAYEQVMQGRSMANLQQDIAAGCNKR